MSTSATPLNVDEIDALVSKLSRAARWWRPVLTIGLIAIVAGFASLIISLDRRARAAEAQAAAQRAQLVDLNQVLDASRIIVRQASADGDGDERWRSLAQLLLDADVQIGRLNTTVDASSAARGDQPKQSLDTKPDPSPSGSATVADAGPATPATAPAVPLIRLYFHIASPEQREAAEAVAARWSGRKIGGRTVVVPGVELKLGQGDNSVRCTRSDSCAFVDEVTVWANRELNRDLLRSQRLDRLYEGRRGIRPGTFEIWFAPGPIISGDPESYASGQA